MKKIGVIANCVKPHAPDVLARLAAKAAELKLQLFADSNTASILSSCETMTSDALFDEVDAVMALGGDGTMLMVVRSLNGRNKPVIGVNLGSLGFMTSVAHEELERALECLANEDAVEKTRIVMSCSVLHDGDEFASYRALNDVVLRSPDARVITLEVSVDGDVVTQYVCDGLIVSTPTGSTGHSLSAGGPILVPGTNAFVISLICPHTLSTRPLVVPDTSEVSIKAIASDGDLAVSVDGQVGQALELGNTVQVRKSSRPVRFLHLPGENYFDVLRQKLKWRGSNI